MKLAARIRDRAHEVVIERHGALFRVEVNGESFETDVRTLEGDLYSILLDGRSYEVSVERVGDAYHVRHGAAKRVVELTDPSRRAREAAFGEKRGPAEVTSVMPGKVVRVLVAVGDEVQAGQGLVVVEAMKMENEIAAPKAGRVVALPVELGRAVEAGATLAIVE